MTTTIIVSFGDNRGGSLGDNRGVSLGDNTGGSFVDNTGLDEITGHVVDT